MHNFRLVIDTKINGNRRTNLVIFGLPCLNLNYAKSVKQTINSSCRIYSRLSRQSTAWLCDTRFSGVGPAWCAFKSHQVIKSCRLNNGKVGYQKLWEGLYKRQKRDLEQTKVFYVLDFYLQIQNKFKFKIFYFLQLKLIHRILIFSKYQI